MKNFIGLVGAVAAACVAACGGSGGGDTVDAGGGTPPPSGETTPQIAVGDAFPSLSFTSPTTLKQAPGNASRWFVAEKSGVIRVFDNDPASDTSGVFLDISDVTDAAGEGGLLGFAFHPDFPVTPEVYVSYTRAGPVSYLSRFSSTDNGESLDPLAEDVYFQFDSAYLTPIARENLRAKSEWMKNNPQTVFVIEGHCDGGGAGDPFRNGQDETTLHGAVVRIDVDVAGDYDIPVDNPNAANARCAQGSGSAPCPEIFAWGLRNPWRFSFDPVTGKLWVGDVGQSDWEEIDVVEVGENYGWNVREGAHCYSPPSGCATDFGEPITDPAGSSRSRKTAPTA